MGIKENTVSAEKQTRERGNVFYYGSEKADKKILIVGNSITYHAPKEDIYWNNSWGMAASRAENDYVHILTGKILSQAPANIMVAQLADMEVAINNGSFCVKDYGSEREFAPDILIYKLGENIKPDINKDYLKRCLSDFIGYICKKDCAVVYSTCFWPNRIFDDTVTELSRLENAYLVSLSDMDADPGNKAYGKFAHAGVAAHPGDKGMREIAERIFAAIQKRL